jgi:SAM-dependent methyltransferase
MRGKEGAGSVRDSRRAQALSSQVGLGMALSAHYARTRQQFERWAVERAGFYDAEPGKPLGHSRWQRMVRRLVLDEVMAVAPAVTRVLDVGCGRGDLLKVVLDQLGASLPGLGLDFAPSVLRLARADQPHARVGFAAAELSHLPVPSRAFDLTLCVNVLHHIELSDQPRALCELSRVTRRHLVLEIKNHQNFYYRYVHKGRVGDGIAVHATSLARVKEELTKHGFGLRSARGVFGPLIASPLLVLRFERTHEPT